MEQVINVMESLTVMADRLVLPEEVKEFINNLISENTNEQKEITPLNFLFLEHQELALLLISFLQIKSKINKKQNSVILYSNENNNMRDAFLKLLKNPDEFLLVEKQMKEEQVIDHDLDYFKNKRLENLKVLQGVFLILEKYCCFNIIDTKKSIKHRTISHRQALSAFNKRYHIKRMRYLSEGEKIESINKALLRLPILKKIKSKRKTYFKLTTSKKNKNELL